MAFIASPQKNHNVRDLELKYKLFETLSSLGIKAAHSSMSALWIDYVVVLSSIIDEGMDYHLDSFYDGLVLEEPNPSKESVSE